VPTRLEDLKIHPIMAQFLKWAQEWESFRREKPPSLPDAVWNRLVQLSRLPEEALPRLERLIGRLMYNHYIQGATEAPAETRATLEDLKSAASRLLLMLDNALAKARTSDALRDWSYEDDISLESGLTKLVLVVTEAQQKVRPQASGPDREYLHLFMRDVDELLCEYGMRLSRGKRLRRDGQVSLEFAFALLTAVVSEIGLQKSNVKSTAETIIKRITQERSRKSDDQ
jgi:hypothetical protein